MSGTTLNRHLLAKERTSYVCSYCKISRHDKCANRSQVLKGICGCQHEICIEQRRADKENAIKSKIS